MTAGEDLRPKKAAIVQQLSDALPSASVDHIGESPQIRSTSYSSAVQKSPETPELDSNFGMTTSDESEGNVPSVVNARRLDPTLVSG